MLRCPSDELLIKAPRIVAELTVPVLLGTGATTNGACCTRDVQAFIGDHRLGNDERLSLTAPDAELDHDQGHILREGVKRGTEPPTLRSRRQEPLRASYSRSVLGSTPSSQTRGSRGRRLS